MKLCMGCMCQLKDSITVCPHCGYDINTVHEPHCLMPGTILYGKYIAGRALEYKGYVVKYIGFDAENNRKVIINEYLPCDFSARTDGRKDITVYSGSAASQFEEGLFSFLNEGNLLSGHRNIAGMSKIYDCIAENETGYIISEHIEGKSLQEVLDEGTGFTAVSAKDTIKEVLQCLDAVHKLGVLHCGVSPDTIYIMPDGSVKLTDFVIAKHNKLKPGYAAEEQYRSDGECGTWTDVYAVGAVLYRMVTGIRMPEASERVLNDNIKMPSSVARLPKSAENAILNSVNVLQKDRTLSASIFLSELASRNTTRRKTDRSRRKQGGIPLWLKIAVPVAACLIVASSITLFNAYKKEAGQKISVKADEKFNTGLDKPYIEFQKNWKSYNFSEQMVEVEFRYDTSVSEETVKEFEDYTKSQCLVNGESLKSIQADKYVIKKTGKNSRIAKIVVASPDRYTYLREWGNTAPEVAGDTVTYDQKKFYGKINKSSDTSKPYGIIKEITVDGNKVKTDKITSPLYVNDTSEGKKNNVIITVYTGPYFCMAKNPGNKEAYYKGKNISDIKFTLKDPGKNKILEQTLIETDYGKEKYNSSYISFIHKEGTIIDVLSEKLKHGRKYDGSRDAGKLFDTVGKKMYYNITVKELKKQGIKIKKSSTYGDNYLVKKVEPECFKQSDEIEIIMATAPTPKPTPEPTPKPAIRQTPAAKLTSRPAYRPASKPKQYDGNINNGKENQKKTKNADGNIN